jgi:hypothetical protein
MAPRSKTLKKDRPTWPPKYYRGLSRKAQATRRREILRFGAKGWRDPSAYTGFRTDRGVTTKASGYTESWRRLAAKRGWPATTSLKEKARLTGVPLGTLKASYDRGMAAWRTGHRPGATQQQWGYARVHSLLLCGKTFQTTDADLVRGAKAKSAKARAWWRSTCKGGGR